MARKPRLGSKSGVYHFINRGVNKSGIFRRPEDFRTFLGLVKEYKERFQVEIYHYCIMSNHFHFLLKTTEVEILSKFAHFVQRRYAYYYCQRYHHSGQVLQSRFKSLPVEDDAYLLECGRYIERNPLAAKLVSDPKDHPYSSYPCYAFSKNNDLLTENPLYNGLAGDRERREAAYQAYVCVPREKETELLLKSTCPQRIDRDLVR